MDKQYTRVADRNAPRPMSAGCSVVDDDGKPCGKPIHRLGWCSKHCSRWYKHGDPTVVLKKRGIEPSYSAIHKRLDKKRGKASAQECVDNCGRWAQQWSYRGGGGGLPYSTNLDDYEPRCQSCHQKLDRPRPLCELADDDGKPCGRPHYGRGMCQRHWKAWRYKQRVAKRNTQQLEKESSK